MVKVLGNVPAVVTRTDNEPVKYTPSSVQVVRSRNVEELGYAERTALYEVTPAAQYDSSNLIAGLQLEIVGTGRPVKVEFFAPGLFAASAWIPVMPFVTVNGGTTEGVAGTARSAGTADGLPITISRRIVLLEGQTYTFACGLMTDLTGVGTKLSMHANQYGRAYLSVESR